VTDTDIEKADLAQKMTSADIAINKAEMLCNEMPMTLNLTAFMDAVEVIRERRKENSEGTSLSPKRLTSCRARAGLTPVMLRCSLYRCVWPYVGGAKCYPK
jgi:hypothetical protein